MTTTSSAVVPDLTKVVFNPSKSVTFVPVAKKQCVNVEITNNSTSDVAIKFKNTAPGVFKTSPPTAKIGVGQKKIFQCLFHGLAKDKCKSNDRFTIVYIAVSKNAVIEKALKNAPKTASKKHKIAILFQGINDQKENETQQPTNNEEEDDKDRQGQMRSKSKAESKAKKVLFYYSKHLIHGVTSNEAAAAGSGNPNSEFRTTRPAGAFTGQVASNEAGGAAANPKSDFRTTRPAGAYTGQVASNTAAGAPVDPNNNGLRTTRPAGAYNNQVTANAGASAENADFKSTKPAGAYDNPQQSNNK
ncbi:hypothetical protein CAEBREN_25663 [Caenorhabditis brenneri]|uniref:Major sperm protein n=1 Tax=Caenorhabditis brenneri TaxID=135651 RepID=G0P4B7_CAEBE|nr:hypothetical protein CAEBREN_25663 [Caenorhabditis brenneri]